MNYLVAAYAIIWLVLSAYVGWLALRLRGARADLDATRQLIEQRDASASPRD